MSTGTQVDRDWAGADASQGVAGGPATPSAGGSSAAKYLTDEKILGIDPPSPKNGFGGQGPRDYDGVPLASTGEDGAVASPEPKTAQTEALATSAAMPEWMRTLAADPKNGGEAQQLWRDHQEFRAAFSSPEEARAVKELLPGGVRDVLSLREATQSVERIDAALFSGDARAQADVVAEMARVNP